MTDSSHSDNLLSPDSAATTTSLNSVEDVALWGVVVKLLLKHYKSKLSISDKMLLEILAKDHSQLAAAQSQLPTLAASILKTTGESLFCSLEAMHSSHLIAHILITHYQRYLSDAELIMLRYFARHGFADSNDFLDLVYVLLKRVKTQRAATHTHKHTHTQTQATAPAAADSVATNTATAAPNSAAEAVTPSATQDQIASVEVSFAKSNEAATPAHVAQGLTAARSAEAKAMVGGRSAPIKPLTQGSLFANAAASTPQYDANDAFSGTTASTLDDDAVATIEETAPAPELKIEHVAQATTAATTAQAQAHAHSHGQDQGQSQPLSSMFSFLSPEAQKNYIVPKSIGDSTFAARWMLQYYPQSELKEAEVQCLSLISRYGTAACPELHLLKQILEARLTQQNSFGDGSNAVDCVLKIMHAQQDRLVTIFKAEKEAEKASYGVGNESSDDAQHYPPNEQRLWEQLRLDLWWRNDNKLTKQQYQCVLRAKELASQILQDYAQLIAKPEASVLYLITQRGLVDLAALEGMVRSLKQRTAAMQQQQAASVATLSSQAQPVPMATVEAAPEPEQSLAADVDVAPWQDSSESTEEAILTPVSPQTEPALQVSGSASASLVPENYEPEYSEKEKSDWLVLQADLRLAPGLPKKLRKRAATPPQNSAQYLALTLLRQYSQIIRPTERKTLEQVATKDIGRRTLLRIQSHLAQRHLKLIQQHENNSANLSAVIEEPVAAPAPTQASTSTTAPVTITATKTVTQPAAIDANAAVVSHHTDGDDTAVGDDGRGIPRDVMAELTAMQSEANERAHAKKRFVLPDFLKEPSAKNQATATTTAPTTGNEQSGSQLHIAAPATPTNVVAMAPHVKQDSAFALKDVEQDLANEETNIVKPETYIPTRAEERKLWKDLSNQLAARRRLPVQRVNQEIVGVTQNIAQSILLHRGHVLKPNELRLMKKISKHGLNEESSLMSISDALYQRAKVEAAMEADQAAKANAATAAPNAAQSSSQEKGSATSAAVTEQANTTANGASAIRVIKNTNAAQTQAKAAATTKAISQGTASSTTEAAVKPKAQLKLIPASEYAPKTGPQPKPQAKPQTKAQAQPQTQSQSQAKPHIQSEPKPLTEADLPLVEQKKLYYLSLVEYVLRNYGSILLAYESNLLRSVLNKRTYNEGQLQFFINEIKLRAEQRNLKVLEPEPVHPLLASQEQQDSTALQSGTGSAALSNGNGNGKDSAVARAEEQARNMAQLEAELEGCGWDDLWRKLGQEMQETSFGHYHKKDRNFVLILRSQSIAQLLLQHGRAFIETPNIKLLEQVKKNGCDYVPLLLAIAAQLSAMLRSIGLSSTDLDKALEQEKAQLLSAPKLR